MFIIVKMQIAKAPVNIRVPVPVQRDTPTSPFKFVETDYQNKLLTEIVQSYAVGDLCLVGM